MYCLFLQVCRKFNEIGSKMLSRGFVQVERRHSMVYKRVKSMLPRRESERRMHPLARYCDVLSAIETRISMLNMTFMKYIDSNMCCFIPGKVLDEIIRLLSLVENNKNPIPRTHELLQEMRDISSMAMEHFEEHILPKLRTQLEAQAMCPFSTTTTPKSSRFFILQHNSVTDDVRKVKKQSKSNKQQIAMLTQYVQKLLKKVKHQNLRIKMQSAKIRDQERKLQEQNMKVQDQEASVADLKKHMDEWDQKFADLTGELNRAREDIGTKSSIPTATKAATAVHSTTPPKFYKSNIRPRMAQILPSISAIHFDLERKRKSNLTSEVPSKLSRSSETSEDPSDKVNESNIVKSIKEKLDEIDSREEKRDMGLNKSDFGSFLSSSLESILKTPISSIRARKRKMNEDIDLK